MSLRNYDWGPAEAYCRERGLVWDTEMARRADHEAAEFGLTQEQFTAAVRLHIDAMVDAFTPARYPWTARIKLAFVFFAFWLGLVKPAWSK